MPLIIFSQRTITGVVKDADTGETLIGVNILVKGTQQGTITDFDGNYEMNLSAAATTLVFSYTGYANYEYALEGSNIVNVDLSAGQVLSEVVVIGYGTVKREDVTGSLQTVGSEDFNKGAITGAQELLAGKIAGVVITTGGDLGGGAKIRIRGETSIGGSNDPLIVIDGVPVESSGISGSRNPLGIVNPNDIESMTVLKDASSAAIYGSRASGGVILITTKKGKLGDAVKIGYTGIVSSNSVIGKVDVLNGDEYRTLVKERYEDETIQALLGTANTDWQDEIYETAIGQDHNLNASGGLGKVPFRASLGYTDKNGVLKGGNYNRLTASLNLTPKFIDNRLQVNVHVKVLREKNIFANRGAIGAAMGFDPTQEVYDPNSIYEGFTTWTTNTGAPDGLAPTNPVALLELRDDRVTINRYITNVSADYRFGFLPELRANLSLASDISKSDGTVDVPETAAFDYDALNGGGTDNEYNQQKNNSVLEFYLNYKKELGRNVIDLMGGYSWQHFKEENFNINSNVSGSEITKFSNGGEYYLLSLFGRLNYSFDNKYLLTATLRRDATSRFSPEARWGLFPSLALGVKLINNDNTYFNNLKLRAGWGTTGQQDIGIGNNYSNYYAYLNTYVTSFDNASYQFGNQFYNTIRPNGYDADIKWEETTSYNIGLDFSLIRNRLSGVFEVYQKDTKDILNTIPVAAGSNLTNFITTNVGDMTNKGVELSLIATPVLTEKISWDFAINIAHNKAEITKLLATDDPAYQGILVGGISGGVGSNIQIHSVGYTPYSFFVYEQLYAENGDLLEGQFADRNDDGLVTEADKYRFSNPTPDYTLGFSSNFKLSNLTFSFAGRANLGGYVYNNLQTDQGYLARLYGTTGVLWNINQSAIDNNVEQIANITFSDHFVQKASFLKIDHITIGYDLSKKLGYGINVFATVQNPIIATKYVGLDPEIGDGIDNNIYPRSRTFLFGVNANFIASKKK